MTPHEKYLELQRRGMKPIKWLEFSDSWGSWFCRQSCDNVVPDGWAEAIIERCAREWWESKCESYGVVKVYEIVPGYSAGYFRHGEWFRCGKNGALGATIIDAILKATEEA